MTRAEEFAAAIKAEDPDLRVYAQGDELVLLAYDPAEAERSVRRLRAYRKFKDVQINSKKIDGECW